MQFLKHVVDKKAQLSLTNPRDAKACQKLVQFDVLTTLSLTILAYLLISQPKLQKFVVECTSVWHILGYSKCSK